MGTLTDNIARLQSVVNLTSRLCLGEFPNSHSKTALESILRVFEKALKNLESIPEDASIDVIHATCAAESAKVRSWFPLIGFIVRSTEVRNALEVHGPFHSIVKQLLDRDARLTISSEWLYSPFTYSSPANYNVTKTVMIGIPVSESSNALIIPLFGHELGHNIWQQKKILGVFASKVEDAVVSAIRTNHWNEFNRYTQLNSVDKLEDLVGKQFWERAWQWSCKQCEEMFCDFIGISLFQKSYLQAFSYFLSPGYDKQPGTRSHTYPTAYQRAKYQLMAADKLNLTFDSYLDRFDSGYSYHKGFDGLLLKIADAATKAVIPSVLDEAIEIVKQAGVTPPEASEIQQILSAYKLGVPPYKSSGITALVIAAWEFYETENNPWTDSFPDLMADQCMFRARLSDLVLKSAETYQFGVTG